MPKYKVLIPFERVNPADGEVTRYEKDSSYSGPDVDKYLADPNPFAPDHGPLIEEVKPVQASTPASQEK